MQSVPRGYLEDNGVVEAVLGGNSQTVPGVFTKKILKCEYVKM
jgi:hypothetical protein